MPTSSAPEGLKATSPSTSSVPPPIDLKHMTSNSLLSPSSALNTSPTTKDERHTHRTVDRANKKRTSQNLRAAADRVGSPGSIPSSPTSVHSSSSAIFERDIEPLLSPSSQSVLQSPTSPHRPLDPHRIPRAKTTEQLEQAVPSVLDSAAAILATLDIDSTSLDPTSPTDKTSLDQIAVVAPAASTLFEGLGGGHGRSSGFASPLSFRSRSPSPLGSRTSAPPIQARQTDLLLNIPIPTTVSPHTISSAVSSPSRSTSTSPPTRAASLSSSPPRPLASAPQIAASISQGSTHSAQSGISTFAKPAPSLVTPTSEYFATTAERETESGASSPTSSGSATALGHTHLPLPNPLPTSTFISANAASSSSPRSPLSPSSHPPSPHTTSLNLNHPSTKRLSFMSYSDLLTSTPASTLPLASLTKEASANEPPPHIPVVSGLGVINAVASSVYGSPHTSPTSGVGSGVGSGSSLRAFSLGSGFGGPTGGLTHPGKRDSIALLDNMGGEWEREGMGMGMEERLDVVIGAAGGAYSPAAASVGLPVNAKA